MFVYLPGNRTIEYVGDNRKVTGDWIQRTPLTSPPTPYITNHTFSFSLGIVTPKGLGLIADSYEAWRGGAVVIS